MFDRIIKWRRSPAGIWTDWFVSAAVSIGLTVTSIALGWHWIITALLVAFACLICGLLILLLSVRNDLGEQDHIEARLALLEGRL